MPRIKRWFHVSHDINSDPEVWELTDRFGDRSLRVWQEILSIAERNDGDIPGWSAELSPQLRRSLAGKCRVSGETVQRVCGFADEKFWTVSGNPHKTRNHLKYNPSREPNKNPDGNLTVSPPTYLPTYLPKEEKNITPNGVISVQRNGHVAPTLPDWAASDLWLKDFLDSQTLIPCPRSALDHPAWWEEVSHTANGLSLEVLQREFAKMGAWLIENPRRLPGTSRGWKRFVRQWLERAYEKERRFPSGDKAT